MVFLKENIDSSVKKVCVAFITPRHCNILQPTTGEEREKKHLIPNSRVRTETG